MKILVVEDVGICRDNAVLILDQLCDIAKEDIELARWYSEAQEKIEGDVTYDVILLDHHMPRVDPEMDDRDDRFYDLCQKIGYGLLPLIREKQPQAVVVGTSSLEEREIGHLERPDRKLTKSDMFDELPALIESIREERGVK